MLAVMRSTIIRDARANRAGGRRCTLLTFEAAQPGLCAALFFLARPLGHDIQDMRDAFGLRCGEEKGWPAEETREQQRPRQPLATAPARWTAPSPHPPLHRLSLD